MITCNEWPNGTRCRNDATEWLIQPNGTKNPGGYVCREHAEAIITEYAAKLGEYWTTVPLAQIVGTSA